MNAYPSIFSSSLTATKPDWIRDKKIKSIVLYGPEREKEASNVPSVSESLKSEDNKLLLEAAIAPLALGRPYQMPPDVPSDRVELMQKAFAEIFADKEFLAEADKLNIGVNVPRSAAAEEDRRGGIRHAEAHHRPIAEDRAALKIQSSVNP